MASGDKGNTTLANAVTTTGTQTAFEVGTDKKDMVATITIVVVGAPTTAAVAQIETSLDEGTSYQVQAQRSTPLAEGTYTFPWIPVPRASTHVRTSFTEQVGGTPASSPFTSKLGWVEV
jgi:hypothetical protein